MARGATVPAASPPQRRAAAAAAVMASLLATAAPHRYVQNCPQTKPNSVKHADRHPAVIPGKRRKTKLQKRHMGAGLMRYLQTATGGRGNSPSLASPPIKAKTPPPQICTSMNTKAPKWARDS